MNKLLSIISNDLKKDKSIYISLICVLIIASIFGIFFITILNSNDKITITNYINTFITNIRNNTFKYNLSNNILNNCITASIIFILGFSIIGILLVIAILFYKGFTLSFTITSLIYTFKFKGIIYSIIYVFPVLILNLILFFILTYYSFKSSIIIINSIGNKKVNIKAYIKKYLFIFIICLVLLVLSSLYETYILPLIFKFII